jgi:hypothetical protein
MIVIVRGALAWMRFLMDKHRDKHKDKKISPLLTGLI